MHHLYDNIWFVLKCIAIINKIIFLAAANVTCDRLIEWDFTSLFSCDILIYRGDIYYSLYLAPLIHTPESTTFHMTFSVLQLYATYPECKPPPHFSWSRSSPPISVHSFLSAIIPLYRVPHHPVPCLFLITIAVRLLNMSLSIICYFPLDVVVPHCAIHAIP